MSITKTETMLLSEAIDRGLADPNFRETPDAWLMRDPQRSEDPSAFCGCAAGAALVGAGGTVTDTEALNALKFGSATMVAMLLLIPRDLVSEMSRKHHNHGIPASDIADWVREEHPDLLVRVAGAAVTR